MEEGATIALDCEGVDPLSGRMDYDEGRRVDRMGVGGPLGREHGASGCDGQVVSFVYGSARECGRGVPLHSEHDVAGIGRVPYGAKKSDGGRLSEAKAGRLRRTLRRCPGRGALPSSRARIPKFMRRRPTLRLPVR